MRETEDCFDLANFFDENNQDQIKVYKVLCNYLCPPTKITQNVLFPLETTAVD